MLKVKNNVKNIYDDKEYICLRFGFVDVKSVKNPPPKKTNKQTNKQKIPFIII